MKNAFAVLILSAAALAQTSPTASWIKQNESAILREYADFLSLPNTAAQNVDPYPNAKYVAQMMSRRGIKTEALTVEGAPPVVYGELKSPGARRTIVIYAHYDGQPVVESQWTSPPFKPVLRNQSGDEIALTTAPLPPEARIFARSSSDDKAPIQAVLSALDALRAQNRALSVNLKFFFEGEEEAGSPHLAAVLKKYADLLKADAWLICDGPVHQSRRPLLYFGARGVTGLELTVYGPTRPLHSGHYGNWAPNPAAMIARLLASMRDDNGRILIPGFAEATRPPTQTELAAVNAAPNVDAQLRRELALGRTETTRRVEESVLYPALNIRGIQAGQVGDKASNAISTEARASIDFRLVPNLTPEIVRAAVESFLEKQGWYIVHGTPDVATRAAHEKVIKLEWEPGYPASRTSMDLPVSRALFAVLQRAHGDMVQLPTLGGSVPMYLFQEITGAPPVGLPIVNHDNNQHAANENLRLQNLWDGIESFAAILSGLGNEWK